jgi:tyrosyl-tRNA synthetase
VDLEARLERVGRFAAEVLTQEDLRALLERSERPRAYIGFEPSGRLTIAHLITARKVLDLVDAGCDVTVFLADWHAWINDKLGGDLARITDSGRTMQAVFESLGLAAPRVRYRWAHELVGRSDYWARVIRVAKGTSLARTRRAMSIMGRGEDEATLDSSKLFYPAMQAADIFELPVELAYGGLDQRRAHVLAREVAEKNRWPVPVGLHTPLLGSLKGRGRMDLTGAPEEGKMSKSDPGSAIVLPSARAEIEQRIGAAFCPAKELDGNPVVEIVRWIAFPWEGRFEVPRAPKHGGPVGFGSDEEFTRAWREGALHPQDLKGAVVDLLDRLCAPVRAHLGVPPTAPADPLAESSGPGSVK